MLIVHNLLCPGPLEARDKVHRTNVFTARALVSTRTTKQLAASIVMSLEQFGFSRGPSKHTVPSATEAALQLYSVWQPKLYFGDLNQGVSGQCGYLLYTLNF